MGVNVELIRRVKIIKFERKPSSMESQRHFPTMHLPTVEKNNATPELNPNAKSNSHENDC